MSQNTQQYPRTDTEPSPLSISHEDDLLAHVDTLKIVACPICRALFVPSDALPIQGSTVLLETAFLNICRFCFRCQRPACPQCWNPVHHTCASCSEEAHLPFRSPVPSLKGLVFSPPARSHIENTPIISFTCQRNGRFYEPETAPSQKVETAPAANKQETSGTFPVFPVRAASETYPTWLQEVLGKKAAEQATASPAATDEPADQITLPQAPTESISSVSPAQEMSQPELTSPTQQPTVPPASPVPSTSQSRPLAVSTPDTEDPHKTAQQQDEVEEGLSFVEHVENVLIVITSILLLAVVSVIVLSIISPQVNAFFLTFLHIDIRTEIAYLLQMRS